MTLRPEESPTRTVPTPRAASEHFDRSRIKISPDATSSPSRMRCPRTRMPRTSTRIRQVLPRGRQALRRGTPSSASRTPRPTRYTDPTRSSRRQDRPLGPKFSVTTQQVLHLESEPRSLLNPESGPKPPVTKISRAQMCEPFPEPLFYKCFI